MKTASDTHHSHFCLEGYCLGLVQVKGKFKYLRLAIGKEELQIKLSKEARATCQATLRPNDWLQVSGDMTIEAKTNDLQLKARQIEKLDSPCLTAALQPDLTPERVASPGVRPRERLTLLTCQKSGCQKKGAKKQQQAIAAILHDRGLETHVRIKSTGCLGKCSMAPNLVLMPGKKRLSGMKPTAIAELISQLTPKSQRNPLLSP